MNFLGYNLYSHTLRYINKNHLLYSFRNFLSFSLRNKQILKNQVIFKKLKRKDTLEKQNKDYKQKNQNKINTQLDGLILLSIPVISFGLGMWQIERRQWKLNLIRNFNDKFNKLPIVLPENLNDLDNLEYHPIKVTGEFLYENEFVIGPRSLILNGQSASQMKQNLIPYKEVNRGYNVITPFKVKDRDLIILVNRGWLPCKYKKLSERKKYQKKGFTEILGIIRLSECRPHFVHKNVPKQGIWNYRDVTEMAKFANTHPVFLDMIKDNTKLEMPIGSQTRINLRNEHLNYILTWFTLSAFTGLLWYRIYFKKLMYKF